MWSESAVGSMPRYAVAMPFLSWSSTPGMVEWIIPRQVSSLIKSMFVGKLVGVVYLI